MLDRMFLLENVAKSKQKKNENNVSPEWDRRKELKKRSHKT
jgi:hypothetical protein